MLFSKGLNLFPPIFAFHAAFVIILRLVLSQGFPCIMKVLKKRLCVRDKSTVMLLSIGHFWPEVIWLSKVEGNLVIWLSKVEGNLECLICSSCWF